MLSYLFTNNEGTLAFCKSQYLTLHLSCNVRWHFQRTSRRLFSGQHLKELGIPVKIQPDSQSFMHHKFFLIDEYTDDKEVWFGSLNLTAQAFTANWESIIYTNDTVMVSNFSKCFEMLWTSFIDL
ncbi:hypothetical protein Trydic_g16643 [Trypoxylus dichotomus]